MEDFEETPKRKLGYHRTYIGIYFQEMVIEALTCFKGHIWDSDLQRNEAVYKEVILAAQGELALEEFLKQVLFSHFSSVSLLLLGPRILVRFGA